MSKESTVTTILVVDDDPGLRFTLGELLSERGFSVLSADSGAAALGLLARADVVLTDLAMPQMDGLSLLAEIRERDPDLPVVLLTAQGSERTAVQAMKAGAWDYLSKPFANDELVLVLARAAEARALRLDARALRLERAAGAQVVGESPAFRKVVDEALRLARREVPVLVRGETGTGKELIATLLHTESARSARPLVRFNCAALPTELAEAELFGHAKGAFTGATSARTGFFQQADGGTLVLDEVGELPLPVQSKLLRALQSGEVQPLGTASVERVDVRVVASTNRDLLKEVRAGRFREDLFYRLAVVEILVPALRERREDIPLLAEAFRTRFAARFGLPGVRFSPTLLEALSRREWPGNVRELENAVARILAFADEREEVGPEALSRVDRAESPPHAGNAPLREQVSSFERSVIERAMSDAGGNQSEAARRLGVTRVTLIDKLKRHGLR